MEEERNWEEMDTDCLANIFGRLGVDDLILSLPFVCKSWYAAALDPLCWQILDFRPLDFMPWSSLAKRFAPLHSISCFSLSSFVRYSLRRSSRTVVELRFPLAFGASLQDLVLASVECPRLKVLALPSLTREDEAEIPELVEQWKELETLELESKPASFVQLAEQISLNCKKFRALKMAGAIKKEDAAAIVDYIPNIKNLNLSKAYLPKQQLMAMLNGCKEIERLSVNECVGFEAEDGDVKKKASRIAIFESRGSKLMVDFDYDTDDCDPLYVCVM